MKVRLWGALAALALALAIVPARAQTAPQAVIGYMSLSGCPSVALTPCFIPYGSSVPTSGSFTATVGGFTPSASGSRMTPLTVTTADSSGTLPTGGVVVVSNIGTTNPMYCNIQGVAATAADQLIPPDSWFAFTLPTVSPPTALHCIATGGSTAANGLGGAGIPTGSGGGGGGGSGSVPNPIGVTAAANAFASGSFVAAAMADGAIVTMGTEADTAWSGSGSGTVVAILKKLNATLGTLFPNNGSISNTGFNALQGGAANTSGNPFFVNCVGGTCSGGGGGSAVTFTPDQSYSTPLSVTNTSAIMNFPASATTGSVIKLYNRGPNTVFWTPVTTTGTATTAMSMLAPNSWDSFIVKAGQTGVAAIVNLASQTAILTAESGTGLPQGTGGPIIQSNNTVGQTVVTYSNTGGTDNAGDAIALGVTAAGTSSTHGAAAIQGVTGGVPVPISGSVTASFSQFTPNGNYSTPLTVGGTSTRTALPAGAGPTIAVYNTGTSPAFVQLGSSAVVATAADDQVAPGGFLCFGVGSNVDIAAIETAGVATALNISGGSGGCAGSGGGGGGSSGSNASVGANTSATPTSSTAIGFSDGSSNLQQVSPNEPLPVTGGVIQTGASIPIDISTATTTQLVALSGSTQINVTSWNVVAGGTGTFKLEYGTGSNCGTGTHELTGPYPLTAQNGVGPGSGLGPILITPAGQALCAVTSAAVQMSGSLSYNQQ